MDEPRDYHTKWIKPERQISYITYMWNLRKMIRMNLFTRQEQSHILREWTYDYWGGISEGRDRLGVYDWHVHTFIFKLDNQQGPAVWHRELCSVLSNNLNGKRI